ncbi:hypothetical protein, unknown function [Leishmania infantum JPCM5]|uniref:Uncharacterized protein n=2 Tax=Leishmania infantum TaxID=5671 RepID=A4I853_LEIIN|nr:hypothetical protein, unknown function [Leishmania infantum JPCM5]CAC9526090.1 hypothetical_protein_-_conserved [Leishmania infantum]CAM70993.1 hypothetical protein, unknown function [Leishmania infantum JPCM5]SUZ44809.1 hypothetical_protein_-_conserved [Leishmania infantum]|eukprot:XP_001467922.1 hypothetical protein, unknown function [Leishmania infantum JPCM5]
MPSQPGSAEELYGLVCALQKQQQLTQVDLRAVQRRTESLRQELHCQEALIAEERARREELAAKHTQGDAERRLAEAHARGAARATADAAQELRCARRAFLQKCHAHVLSIGKGPTDPRRPGAPVAPRSCTPFSSAADESCSGSLSAVGAEPRREATLMPAAAVHQLLFVLREKLTRCIEVGATEGSSSEQPRDCRPSDEQGAAVKAVTSVMSPLTAEKSPPWPPSKSVTDACVHGEADGRSSPREKKRIGFAPECCFERVTAVPAANVNRGTRKTWLTEGAPGACGSAAVVPPSANVTLDGDNHPSNACLRNGSRPRTQRGSGHFTVRVASRSATLVAEAAAVGAKRQRISEAATATQSSPPKAARADGDKGVPASRAPQGASAAAAFSPAYSNNRGRLVAPVDLLSPRSAEARRNGSSGSSRRTVWTWTRGTSREQ